MTEQEEFEFRARMEAESAPRAPKPAAAPAPSKPFGQQLNDSIADVPRQIGLTARHGLEGAGDVFDTFVGNPVRTLASPILGNKPTARTGAALADLARLPQPRTATERIVGDAARMVAGGAGTLGAAAKGAQRLTGVAQGVARTLAANPVQQLASAGAAGAAGGYTRETGGNDGAQLAASLAAGIATPFAANKVAGLASRLNRRVVPQDPQQINITINSAIEQSGLRLDQLPPRVAQSIRDDVAKAFRTTDQVSPDAVRRLADYRLTNLTPTAAGLTGDAAVVTQQKNLAKLGMNSNDKTAQFLGQTENRNNQLLKNGLNDLGAGAADDAYAGGERVIGALERRNERATDVIGRLYDRARDSGGRSAELDHTAFTQRAGDLLHEANVESFLTPDIRNKLNSFALAGSEGGTPLTVEIAEQFKTNIGRLQRSSADGNVRFALGAVRQALEETPLLAQRAPAAAVGGNQLATSGGLAGGQPGQELGQSAINAFNKARRVNRMWMQTVERTPALQAVRDGVEPDKFVQQFIVGGGKDANFSGVAQLKHSIKSNPVAMQSVRDQILGHLKSKALGGMPDETGNFGSAAYVKALDAIGERKLRLFFQPSEIQKMQALGRVARYEQFQPAGGAVNNSNTAGAVGGLVERYLGNIPGISPFLSRHLAEPVKNIRVGMQSSRALNVPRTLAMPGTATRQPVGMLASPALFLSQDEEEEAQRRRLLSP
jgi:hypothetical protein